MLKQVQSPGVSISHSPNGAVKNGRPLKRRVELLEWLKGTMKV